MKKSQWSILFFATSAVAIFGVSAFTEAGGFRHYTAVVSDCSECDSVVIEDYSGGRGGYGASGWGRTGARGRRAIPAPVYFANTYPEYLYGSPNIYAGFDAYDQDIAFVSPVVAKTPFKYRYWNDQYENNPYYGKQWDKNWTMLDEGPSVTKEAASAGNDKAQINKVSPAAENAPQAAPESEPQAAPEETSISTGDETSYNYSPIEGTYAGHFIYNFESFCDNDVCLFRPLANAVRAIFGCPYRVGCATPVYMTPYCDPFADVCVPAPCYDGVYVDPCCDVLDGATFDSCCGQDGVIVDSAVQSDKTDTADEIKTDAAPNLDQTAPASKNSDEIQKETAPADSATPAPADSEAPAIPLQNPAGEDDFQDLLNPKTTQVSREATVGCIRMTVPEDAIVVINDYQTKMTGVERQFVAKNLIPGESYSFEIKVLVKQNGQILTGVKNAVLHAGQSTDIAFNLRDLDAENEKTLALK